MNTDGKLAKRIHEHIDSLRLKLASTNAAICDANAELSINKARANLIDAEIEQLKNALRLTGLDDRN
ncbi:MAG: hypothetical protein PVH19_01640 [Planctomycetia bacterium]|jgi:hypothetical protein